jgi:hypothetical protein
LRDACERDRRDVEPVLADERQQQIERPVEDLDRDAKRSAARALEFGRT